MPPTSDGQMLEICPVPASGFKASSRFAPDVDDAAIRKPLNSSLVALISMVWEAPPVTVKELAGLIKAPSIRTSKPKKLSVPSPLVAGR
jgi:hypothetical protein